MEKEIQIMEKIKKEYEEKIISYPVYTKEYELCKEIIFDCIDIIKNINILNYIK